MNTVQDWGSSAWKYICYVEGLNGMSTKVNEKVTTIVDVVGCSELVDFDPDDAGNAEAVAYRHGDKILWVKEWGWLVWTGQYWKQDEEAITRLIGETLKQRHVEAARCDKYKVEAVTKRDNYRIQAAKEQLKGYVKAEISEFDNEPDILNVANGVLNLTYGLVLEEHKPSQRFTYVVPVEYDDEADSAEWERFISEAVTPYGQKSDEELIDFIQRAVGYSFTGWTREERLFYIYGPMRSGKGTFTESLLALLPRPLSMEVDFNTFTAKRDGSDQNFDLAGMKSSRLVFASESNKYQALNPAKIKQLTGGNDIRAAFKGRDAFTYRPQYTVWLSSNHKVNGDPEDDALWYRVVVVEFPNSHAGNEDTELKERLRSPEVQKGILKWVVEGATMWNASKRLELPEQIKLATKKQRDELDTFGIWLEDKAKIDPEAYTPFSCLYSSYKKWCEENGVTPKQNKEFAESLKRRGFQYKRTKAARLYKGLHVECE